MFLSIYFNDIPLSSRHNVSERVVVFTTTCRVLLLKIAWFNKQHNNYEDDKNDEKIDNVNDKHEGWNNEENKECYWEDNGWNVDLYPDKDDVDSSGNNNNKDNGNTTI